MKHQFISRAEGTAVPLLDDHSLGCPPPVSSSSGVESLHDHRTP
jgi:hypothetical protein